MHLLGYYGSNWPCDSWDLDVVSLTHIRGTHILPFRVTKTAYCAVSV